MVIIKNLALLLALLLLIGRRPAAAFQTGTSSSSFRPSTRLAAAAGEQNDDDNKTWRNNDDKDSNAWTSSSDPTMDSTDWENNLESKNDGTYWSSFEGSEDTDNNTPEVTEEEDGEAWLNTLAALGSEEVEFNMKEADRADKARRMQEWGFGADAIANTLDVMTDTSLEDEDQVEGMKAYRDTVYEADLLEDLKEVESHTKVEIDPDSGDPVRAQMVYVDEHACIGCTNCAMIADNTFYMNDEYGRARVYNQWGDDDETIQIAIETCPVDCIHYVPFPELKSLEIDRRDLNLNFKGRLVGNDAGAHNVGGAVKFSEQQKISGNMASRCNNCPSRGCKNCPMFGVGKNPEFEKKEKLRKENMAKRKLARERAEQNKSANL